MFSPSFKAAISLRAASINIVALSYRGCKVRMRSQSRASRESVHHAHGHGTVKIASRAAVSLLNIDMLVSAACSLIVMCSQCKHVVP